MAVAISTARNAVLLAVLWMSCFARTALAQQEIVTLPTRPGVTQSYFLTSIPKELQAVAILFPGSGGSIQLRKRKRQAQIQSGQLSRAQPLRVHQARRRSQRSSTRHRTSRAAGA